MKTVWIHNNDNGMDGVVVLWYRSVMDAMPRTKAFASVAEALPFALAKAGKRGCVVDETRKRA